MNDHDHEPEIAFRTEHRGECMESRLVLEAAGIASEVVNHQGQWRLIVQGSDFSSAMAELAGYQQEKNTVIKPNQVRVPTFHWAFVGVVGYAAIIVLIAIFSASPESRPRWISIGRMHAADVVAGQYWRTVTALTLHNDIGHLLSNLAYGCVFGLLAGRILGGGVAWLTIVIAGSLGNLLNAVMRDPDHSSIGASTAVFAALGVMVAHALRPRSTLHEKALKRWSPLICGVVLLAFTGVGGERTDVGAHVAGFFGGLVMGWIASNMPDHWLASGLVQSISGVIACGIVILAWAAAIITAN